MIIRVYILKYSELGKARDEDIHPLTSTVYGFQVPLWIPKSTDAQHFT